MILAAAVPAAAAAGPASLWDLALPDQARQCRLTLRGDADGKGARVGMPSGCHRAFPSLKGVTLWAETGDGRLQFEDGLGQPLIVFDPAGDGFAATTSQGERLALRPATAASGANLAKAAGSTVVRAEVAPAAGKPPATPKKAATSGTAAAAMKPAEIAGRYAVLRDKTRDTGCMVTLDDKAGGSGGALKARLAPACRDQGIVIFDPVGWQVKNGDLVLTARKGHTTDLGLQDDGTWMNHPKKGATLSLKRI